MIDDRHESLQAELCMERDRADALAYPRPCALTPAGQLLPPLVALISVLRDLANSGTDWPTKRSVKIHEAWNAKVSHWLS